MRILRLMQSLTNRGHCSSDVLTKRHLEKMSASSSSTSQQSASAEERSSADDLVHKRKSTAYVWNYFGFRPSDALQRQVVCKTCRTSVSTSRGNTTNLYQHLQRYHRKCYDECMAKKSAESDECTSSQPPRPTSKQTSIAQALESCTPYDKSSRRYGEITDAITRYLAKDMVPINAVTKDGFKHLILTIDKRYCIPSRTFFTQAIQNLYNTCRQKVEEAELKDVQYYATTTDMWSSRTTEPYKSLTVHFISEDFELNSRCLQAS